MSIKDLANKLEPQTSRQNLNAKLKRDNLTERDLHEIAKACGVTYESFFFLEDDRKI